jgi:predicted transcriptional regulator
MPSRADMRPTPWGLLGDLELAVLDRLWEAGEADAKAVHAKLGRRRGITLNTVQSAMKRLHEKGLLRRSKVSHAFVYAPALTRDAFHREAVGDVVAALLHGEADAMVAAFVGVAERAGHDTLAQLEALVADRRKAARRSK